MRNSRGAMILISFPHQIVHALAALQADRKNRNLNPASPVTIFVWSYRWIDHKADVLFIKVIRELAQLSNCTIYHLSLWERVFKFSEYRGLLKRVNSLTKIFSEKNYNSFYYSHDVSADHTAQVFMQFLPNAHRVCFGDPPGFLFKKYASVQERLNDIPSGLKHWFWNTRIGNSEQWFNYDSAYVAMNMNNIMYPTPPIILSREHFIKLIHLIKKSMSDLETQEKIFLKGMDNLPSNFNMLVLSNLTKSKLITRENELKLYHELSHRHCKPGSTIIIKPHIASNYSFILRLKKILAEYNIIILPEYLSSVPLEMLTLLLKHCKIISVSSASVFLSYLYGKENIIHALTKSDIKRFFNEGSCHYMIEATKAITGSIDTLN
jgi:hypothetical protein